MGQCCAAFPFQHGLFGRQVGSNSSPISSLSSSLSSWFLFLSVVIFPGRFQRRGSRMSSVYCGLDMGSLIWKRGFERISPRLEFKWCGKHRCGGYIWTLVLSAYFPNSRRFILTEQWPAQPFSMSSYLVKYIAPVVCCLG